MPGKPFTEREDRYILDNYHDTKLRDLAKILGRRHSSVQSRFKVLGLEVKPKNLYKEGENELLMNPAYSTRELARMINRSRASVAYRRSLLGFKYPKKVQPSKDEPTQPMKTQRPPAVYDNKGYLYLMEKYGQAI